MEQKLDIQQLIKDTAYMVANSTNKEHSHLIAELRIQNTAILGGMDFLKDEALHTNEHLSKLNGSVAKHADKLSQIDVINAQTTLSQQQIMQVLKELTDSDKENTKYRFETKAVITAFQWLAGFIGLGTFALVAKYILNVF